MEVIFWLCAFLLFYTYLLYPVILRLLTLKKRRGRSDFFNQDDELPTVSILISVYNEEKAIEERIHNIFTTNYPLDKIEVIVGSDASSDNTNRLLIRLQNIYPALRTEFYAQRRGKPSVLNDLYGKASHNLLIFTDAKVLFSPQAIFQLIKHFKNTQTGIVSGNIVNKRLSSSGISYQETMFMSNEMDMKFREGYLWGTAMGAYGACYAIRRELWSRIPDGYSVEDFYITMKVLEQRRKSLLELNALCYENVPNNLNEEYTRKVRISAGNFQNLSAFRHLVFRPSALSFSFISHKFLRWFGPLFILACLATSIPLAIHSSFYLYIFIFQIIIIEIPLIDIFLHLFRIDIIILRFITHFYSMNLALFMGMVKFLKGVKTNVWEPTKREH